MEVKYIVSVPVYYSDWLECFDILQNRIIDTEELQLLRRGECRDFSSTAPFLEEQMIKTINLMIRKYVRCFQRELNLCQTFGEYDSFQRPFAAFAKRTQACMFFTELNFLSSRFRTELKDSVESEVKRLWSNILNSLYLQCIDGNPMLEEQLMLIKRIKLFPEPLKATV